MPAAELAAPGLGAKPKLDCGRGRRGREDSAHRNQRLKPEASSQRGDKGKKDDADALHDGFDLGAEKPRRATGADPTRSGASSPDMVSQASPPASWPAAMISTGTSTIAAPPLP